MITLEITRTMGSSEVAEPSGTLSWPPWARTAGARRRKSAGNTPPGGMRVDIAIVKIVEGEEEDDRGGGRVRRGTGRGKEKRNNYGDGQQPIRGQSQDGNVVIGNII